MAVERKLHDLLPVVRNNVYHPRFNGSFSLKSVAPPLAPGISYAGLEIAGGGEASQMLYDLLFKGDGMKEARKERLRRELLRYCRMDTEALVAVHRALVGLA